MGVKWLDDRERRSSSVVNRTRWNVLFMTRNQGEAERKESDWGFYREQREGE